MQVSIPGGICSSLRRSAMCIIPAPPLCFNPRRDLFLFATDCCQLIEQRFHMFQSQAGFVPLCDIQWPYIIGDKTLCFNPRRDLFLFATMIYPMADLSIIQVSIPGGICSSLRRGDSVGKGKHHAMFQSQAGFVPLCDDDHRRLPEQPRHVSIPGGICSSLRRNPGGLI